MMYFNNYCSHLKKKELNKSIKKTFPKKMKEHACRDVKTEKAQKQDWYGSNLYRLSYYVKVVSLILLSTVFLMRYATAFYI